MMRLKPGKQNYTLLAVACGNTGPAKDKNQNQNQNQEQEQEQDLQPQPTPPPLPSAKASQIHDEFAIGLLEVQVLEYPSRDELKQSIESLEPDIVYFRGKHNPTTDEIGPFDLPADCFLPSVDGISALFGTKLPELIYLDVSGGNKLGEAAHKAGVPYVIFWKNSPKVLLAAHFRRALVAVLQSIGCQVWSAYQFADASFRLHCSQLRAQGNGHPKSNLAGPLILGEPPPKLQEPPKTKESEEDETSPSPLPAIQLHDEETDLRILACVEHYMMEAFALKALEDGLNALLTVEVRGIRLLHRVSAPPPPSMSVITRGVVTMRCDLCTSSSARISLLVSGSAQICFDDQILEYCIKKELLEKAQMVSSILPSKGSTTQTIEPRRSISVACGSSVIEYKFRTMHWALQVLRQLTPEVTFHSLAALGIAAIQGFSVASFQKEDAKRLLLLRSSMPKRREVLLPHSWNTTDCINEVPSWFSSPVPSKKRHWPSKGASTRKVEDTDEKSSDSGLPLDQQSGRHEFGAWTSSDLAIQAMKPVPHVKKNRPMPFMEAVIAGSQNSWSMKVNMANGTGGKSARSNISVGPVTPSSGVAQLINKTILGPSQAQMLSIKPVPMKKHGCTRPPINECSEDEFLKDVMHFLISRGHSRLVPSTKIELFPEAVLNGKRLDLFNLYREVVTRGGFYVGNGINWKGQVFAKMRNHTLVNKLTGVGNTLKKHYETYLLEYELAHDDVDGECCLLCHSSTPGDWVNCSICGEWAHYGCDKRNGLGAFKEYAKNDGLEYICPRCCSGQGATGKRKFKSHDANHS